jgi:hypothetical protein
MYVMGMGCFSLAEQGTVAPPDYFILILFFSFLPFLLMNPDSGHLAASLRQPRRLDFIGKWESRGGGVGRSWWCGMDWIGLDCEYCTCPVPFALYPSPVWRLISTGQDWMGQQRTGPPVTL